MQSPHQSRSRTYRRAETDRDSLEGPVNLFIGLIVASLVGLREGDLQRARVGIPTILTQLTIVRAADKVRNALILPILESNGHPIGLDHQGLEDGQSLLIVIDGLDQAIIGNGHHEDIALIPGIGRGANGNLGRTSTLVNDRGHTGLGRGIIAAVVCADGPRLLDHRTVIHLLQEGDAADHITLICFARGPGAFANHLVGDQGVVDIIESHERFSFQNKNY